MKRLTLRTNKGQMVLLQDLVSDNALARTQLGIYGNQDLEPVVRGSIEDRTGAVLVAL